MNKLLKLKIFRFLLVTTIAITIIAALVGPIIIGLWAIGDAHKSDFIEMNIETEFELEQIASSGNGSLVNPYIIDSLELEGGVNWGVHINYLNCSFSIQNCFFPAFIISTLTLEGSLKEISIINNTFYGGFMSNNIEFGSEEEYNENSKITITNNTFSGSVYINSAHDSIISNNTFVYEEMYRSEAGLRVDFSRNICVENNKFFNSGLVAGGWFYEEDTLTSIQLLNNFVNDLPLILWNSSSNIEFENISCGQLLIFDCSNISIRNFGINNTSTAVIIFNGKNCTFDNAKFYSNYRGIQITNSTEILFKDCIFQDNNCGMFLDKSERNYINNCIFTNRDIGIYINGYGRTISDFEGKPIALVINNTFLCHYTAITIDDSNCIILNNHFEGSKREAIWISGNNNTLYLNSFINNNEGELSQVEDNGLANLWYNETSMIGNKWSDWSGTGVYSIQGDALSEDKYPSLIQETILDSTRCYVYQTYSAPFYTHPFFIFFMIDGSIFLIAVAGIIYTNKLKNKYILGNT